MKKIIKICLMLSLILALVGCNGEDQAEPYKSETGETIEGSTNGGAIEELPSEFLTDVRCINGEVQAILTNVYEKDGSLQDDAKILFNGIVVKDYLCDQDMIKMGESVYCSNLAGSEPLRDGKNLVLFNFLRGKISAEVDC